MAGGGRAGRGGVRRGRLCGRGNRGVGHEPDSSTRRPPWRSIPAALRAGRVFSAEAVPLCAGTACACGALLAWARSLGTKGARRDGEEHGSSRWATRKDIAPFGDPKDPDNNIILTDNARIRLVSRRFDLSTDTNDNVLVVGGPGTGKTRYYVKPNLLQANASFFVTDPKGTLIREMGGALAELGYEIRAFDTIDFTRSMRFNPIAYIRDEAGVIRFARGIVANTEGDADHKGDPYWEKAERLVYTALTAYLVMHCEPADRNLDGLLTLLSLADARDDPGYMSPLDMVFRELETGERYVRRGGASAEGGSLRGFSEEDGAWEWVKVREPAPPDDFALASYREFRVAAGDTMKSMLSSCNVRLKPLSIRAVRDLTSKDELDLAHMGDEGAKVALFASMSDTDSTFDFLFALLMDTAVSALCAEALEAHGGSLPTTVHFVFDEFANIGRIPDFERTIAVTRSRNIAVSMIAQSLSQLKETYGDNNAETIVNACDTLLYLGGKANETNEEISKMAGKQTVASETQSDFAGRRLDPDREPRHLRARPHTARRGGAHAARGRARARERVHAAHGPEVPARAPPALAPARGGRPPRPVRLRGVPQAEGRRLVTGPRRARASPAAGEEQQGTSSTECKGEQHARKRHQARVGLRDLPRRLPGRVGSGLARPGHQGAAGRPADRDRHFHHRRRRDHHRRVGLLRAAGHVLAAGIGGVADGAPDTGAEGHRGVRGEDRREDEPAHARMRVARLRQRGRGGGLRPPGPARRRRGRGLPDHALQHAVLARRVLAALRHARRGAAAAFGGTRALAAAARVRALPRREPPRGLAAPGPPGTSREAQGKEERSRAL